jgi:hypothetical protein
VVTESNAEGGNPEGGNPEQGENLEQEFEAERGRIDEEEFGADEDDKSAEIEIREGVDNLK